MIKKSKEQSGSGTTPARKAENVVAGTVQKHSDTPIGNSAKKSKILKKGVKPAITKTKRSLTSIAPEALQKKSKKEKLPGKNVSAITTSIAEGGTKSLDGPTNSKKLKKKQVQKPKETEIKAKPGSSEIIKVPSATHIKKRKMPSADDSISTSVKKLKKKKKAKQIAEIKSEPDINNQGGTANASHQADTKPIEDEALNNAIPNLKKWNGDGAHSLRVVKPDTKITLQVGSVKKPLVDFGEDAEKAVVTDSHEDKLDDLEKEGQRLPVIKTEEATEAVETEAVEPKSDESKRQTEAEMVTQLRKEPSNGWLWGKLIKNNAETKGLEAARARCIQALEIIPFRMEDQKLWMWVAMLEAELVYGDKESLKNALRKASALLEEIKVLRQMAKVYIRHEKLTGAEECYAKMMTKSKNDVKVWGEMLTFMFQNDLLDKARHLMNRGLKTLPQPRHIDLISKVAQLELKYGDKKRGIQLFESLVNNFPKRTDIWSIYIDMAVKAGLIEESRCLLQRACAQKLNHHKTKLFLRRFMDFEKKHGTEINLSAVRDLGEKFCISLD